MWKLFKKTETEPALTPNEIWLKLDHYMVEMANTKVLSEYLRLREQVK